MTEARVLGVAEAKRRFSELLDRVQRGERFIVERHGRPAVALVPPVMTTPGGGEALGFGAFVGALADWPEIEGILEDIRRSRARAKDRPAPDLS